MGVVPLQPQIPPWVEEEVVEQVHSLEVQVALEVQQEGEEELEGLESVREAVEEPRRSCGGPVNADCSLKIMLSHLRSRFLVFFSHLYLKGKSPTMPETHN